MKHQAMLQMSSPVMPEPSSDTRSVLILRPATLGALLRTPCALRVFVPEKCTPSVLGARHLHGAPRRGDPNTLRANPAQEKTTMNTVSLSGMIVSVPTVTTVDKGLNYTSFRIRVHAAYLDDAGDAYTYVDEHTIICVGQLANMLDILPRDEEITIIGELRMRTHVYRIGEPININIAYPFSEVVANSITWRDLTIKRTAGEETLIAIYRPDPQ
jgi:hypothetical protein